jgi:hypothetical protein
MQMDQKTAVGSGLAVLGLVGAALAGLITWTTPGEEQCQAELTSVQIDLADQKARLELVTERVKLLTETKDACKTALKSCAGETP